MKQREYFKRIVVFLLGIIYLIAVSAVFAVAWYGFYRLRITAPFWRRGNYVLIGIYSIVTFMFSKMSGGLRVGFMKKLDIVYALAISSVCANIIVYLQIVLIHRWFLPLAPMLMVQMCDFGIIILWTLISGAIYIRLYPPHRMLLIYGDRKPDSFEKKVDKRNDKYDICAKVNINDAGEDEVYRMMRDYEAVIIWDLPAAIRNRLLKYCFSHSIRCYVTPKISDILIKGSERIHLFDTPLLLSRNMGLTAEQVFFKRTMDIVISLVGIILSSPLMLISAVLIKAYDGGPVIYKQERVTIGGKLFMIYKFRSMCMDSEKNGAQLATQHDSRITPVGRILRNLHFDELPQLFNVLKGDMSIVGPRPERREIMHRYEKEIPEFYYRLKVKAGLTGYAQVYGKYNTVPYDKLKLDLFYIQNYSLWLDIKLMFMTFRILFQKETSEGVGENQTTALTDDNKGDNKDDLGGDSCI